MKEFQYTKEMLLELMKCSNDPIHFAKTYFFAEGTFSDKHAEVLKAFTENKQVVWLNDSLDRADLVAAYALWNVMFKENQAVLIVSGKNGSQDSAIGSRIKSTLVRVPEYIQGQIIYSNKHRLEFFNGSRLMWAKPNACVGRGLSLNLLILDSFTEVKQEMQREIFASLAPCLACTPGRFIITDSSSAIHPDGVVRDIWLNSEHFYKI